MIDEFGPTLKICGNAASIDKFTRAILTGQRDFAADIKPGQKLFGRLLGSAYANASVKTIDTSAAEALKGVAAVITYKDAVGMGSRTLTRCGFVSQDVYHHGDTIAAVAAVDEDTAEEALQLIKVDYTVRPFVLNPDDAIKTGAPLVGLWPDANSQINGEVTRGDIQAGFMAADITTTETIGWTAYYQHNQLEPYSAVSWWIGDEVYLQICSQYVHDARVVLGACFKMPLNKIHFKSHATGGGFGSKSASGDHIWVTAALLSRKAGGMPVQIHLSRRENFLNNVGEHADKAIIKIGAKKDGTLTAVDMQMYGDGGAATWSPVGGYGNMQANYKCPNAHFRLDRVLTNKPLAGHFRNPSGTPGGFMSDIAADRLCTKLNINPLDFRMAQGILDPLALNQDSKNPYSNNGLKQCMDWCATTIGWSQNWHAPGTKTLADGRMHGLGFAASTSAPGGTSAVVGAIVNMTQDGKAFISSGLTEPGCGTNTVFCHIVAETIGMSSVDDVSVGEQGNTDTSSEAGSQTGSTRTVTLGPAFENAAIDCRNQLLAAAAIILKVTVAELDISDGKIWVKADPTKTKTIAEVTSAQSFTIIGHGYGWTKQLRKPVGTFAIGHACEMGAKPAAACEVAVDTETGEVEILNWAEAIDCGRVLFRKGAMGQVESGMEFLMQWNMTWEEIFDEATGALLNPTFRDHRFLTPMDIPTEKNHIKLFETIDACGPYGATGLGEPPVAVSGCIANAIANAIGVRVDEASITPMRILKALGKA
jgi:xanthine dehydrogenase molybdenum-binding subunit